MINFSDIKNLAKVKTKDKGNFIVSIYLNTDRRLDQHEKYLATFKDMSKDIEKEAHEQGAENVKNDLAKIEKFLTYEFDKKAKGLVLFSCQAENIWQVFEIPIGTFDQYFLAHTPFINHLLMIIEDYERFCILLIDRQHARIFTVYLGKIEEHFDIFDKVIGRHKKGGSSAARFSRHREDETQKHLKKVSSKLFRFFKKEKFDNLIIGYDSPEIIPLLESSLHPWLRTKIVGKFDVEMFASDKDILNESLEIENNIELQKESDIVKNLENSQGPNGKGVTGIDDTLFELQNGRVQQLIIYQGFTHKGRECKRCKYLDGGQEKVCPLCKTPMHSLNNVVERVVKKALELNIKIKFVRDKNMINLGKIGAILRF